MGFPCCYPGGDCDDMLTGEEWVCEMAGGYPFPEGTTCVETDCEQIIGACCKAFQVCEEMDVQECEDDGGTYMGLGTVCDDVECDDDGCRPARDDDFDPGDSLYNLDTCSVAPMMLVQRPGAHRDEDTEASLGAFEPVTAWPTRSTYRAAHLPHCRYHYGMMALFPDGRIRPVLCSRPESAESSARYNIGFFGVVTADQPDGVFRKGQIVPVVGSESRLPHEVKLMNEPVICMGSMD